MRTVEIPDLLKGILGGASLPRKRVVFFAFWLRGCGFAWCLTLHSAAAAALNLSLTI